MNAEINKLAHFKNAVLNDAEKKAEIILNEAEKKTKERIKELETAVLNSEKSELFNIDKQVQATTTRKISSCELDSNRNVLLHRKAIIDKVFDEVKNKLETFKNSDEYQKYLLDSLNKCMTKFPDQIGVIAIGKADEKYADILKNKSKFNIETKLSIQLGGLLVSYPEINVMIDFTFDSALEEEKENFCNVSLLAL